MRHWRRRPPVGDTERAPALSDSWSCGRDTCSAGARPTSIVVRTETTSVNSRTAGSIATRSARGIVCAPSITSPRTVQCASTSPLTVPAALNARHSVMSCRTRRPRPAPSASRTASSRCRSAPLASSRFARLLHAMRRTRATAPSRTSSAVRACPTIASEREVTATDRSWFCAGYCVASCAAIVRSSAERSRGDIGLEAADGADVARRPATAGRVEIERRPDIRCPPGVDLRMLEIRREHRNDGEGQAAEHYRPADDAGIGAEGPAP